MFILCTKDLNFSISDIEKGTTCLTIHERKRQEFPTYEAAEDILHLGYEKGIFPYRKLRIVNVEGLNFFQRKNQFSS